MSHCEVIRRPIFGLAFAALCVYVAIFAVTVFVSNRKERKELKKKRKGMRVQCSKLDQQPIFGALAEILSLNCLNLFDALAMTVFGHFSTQPRLNDLAHFRARYSLTSEAKNVGVVMLARVASHCR